jgi:hypothetical protein
MGRRRLPVRVAGRTLGALLFLAGCARGTPPTGAEIEVLNGDGVMAPRYLLFDWRDSDSVLVQDRRVPQSGFLDPNAHPLAVVRIAADSVADPQRRIVVRGMVDEQTVSQGEGSVSITAGSWQTATVVLSGAMVPTPDAGAPPDDGEADGGAVPDDAADGQAPVDVADSPDAADAGALPADAEPVDGAPDLPGADLPRDLAPDAVTAVVALPAIADSYAEQGGSGTSGANFGKATILEVKTQGGADNNRIAFLRFSLASLVGTTPMTATLRLYGKGGGGTNMLSAYGVTDETWTETAITWNNKPALGAKQATISTNTTQQYREWNVITFVKAQLAGGRDNVNLAVSMDNDTANGPDTYNSREATSNQPQLVITR